MHVGTIDVMCGFGGALGVAAELYQKYRHGRIGRGRTSLAANSGLLQIPFCYDYQGRGLFNEPTGPEVNGYDALTRFYSTASGIYVLLSAYERDLPRLDKVEGLEGIAEVPEEGRAAFLSQAFQWFSGDEWVERLQAADIGVAICNNIDALRAEHTRLADGTPGTQNGSYSFSYYPDHPIGHEVTQLDPYAVRTAVCTINALQPTEKFGSSTRSILQELGYGQEAIQKLILSGEISESWSKEYLPS